MPTPYKVLHVIHSGAIGGGPRVVLDLAANCPGSHTIASMADGPLLGDARDAGIATIQLRHAGKISMSRSIPLLVARSRDVDIVHLHGQFAAFYGASACRLSGRPVVYTAHFPSFMTDSGPITRTRNHLAELLPCRVARVLVTCSEASRREYLRRRLAPESRIVTIYNGVPNPKPSAGAATLRQELDLQDSTVVLALGRFTEQKGFDLLVAAFSRVLPHVPRARLVLVGDGPLRGALETQCRRLGIAAAVRFTGFRRDTPDLYELASIVAVPSRYDIFPLVPLEAMRAGRPVVTSDLPVFHEALRDGETGIIAPRNPDRFAAALVALLANPEGASALGERARNEAAQRFTVDRMVCEYAALYEGLRGVPP